jgi:cytochrome b561
MGSSAGNYGQALFGVIPIPNLIPVLSATEAVWLYAFHKSLIPYFLTFLGLHVLAVLYHSLILKDGILRRMWFFKPKD